MAQTIEDAFREFHGSLNPTPEESHAAKKQRAVIHECSENNFGKIRLFRTGSFGNGTSIRGYSDIDYFACISPERLKPNSSTTLQEVKEALSIRFPNTKIKDPAVVIDFRDNSSRPAEIVPAKLIQQNGDGNFIYEIANGNGNGGWLRSSPDIQNKYVREVHKKLGRKVKPLVTFLKAWKYYHGVPILSFYLEMRVAKYASQKDFIDYSRDVRGILKLLKDKKQLETLKDPKGISGRISPCSSKAQKDALSKLETAFKHAENAREAEKAGKVSDAFDWWNLVFAGEFPSYN